MSEIEKKELIKNSDSYGFFQKIKNNKIIIIALIIAIAIIAILVLNFIIRKKLEERRNTLQYIKNNIKQIEGPLDVFLKEICTKINIDKKDLNNHIGQGEKLYIEKSACKDNNSCVGIKITFLGKEIYTNEISNFGDCLGRLYIYYKEITQNIESIQKNKILGHNNNSDCKELKKCLKYLDIIDNIFDNIVIKDIKGNGKLDEHSMKSLFSKGEFLNKIYNLDLFSSGCIKKEEIKQGMTSSIIMLNLKEISPTKKNKFSPGK